jgi:hypothetical protein
MMRDEDLAQKRAELDAIRKETEAELSRRVLPEPSKRRWRNERRLILERELAAATGDEYAEPLSIDLIVGDEWYLITGFVPSTALLCGDVGKEGALLLEFKHVVELRFGGLNDEVFDAHPLNGKGLGVYGIFVIRNSSWRRCLKDSMSVHPSFSEMWWLGFEHYIIRGKGGEMACLARGCEWRVLRENIIELRDKVAFWKKLSQ